MKNLLRILFFVTISVTFLVSCKKDDVDEVAPVPLGKITGKIVAPSNAPIKVAAVFINNGGKLYITQTDATGSFVLEAPAGNRKLTIQTGDGSMFRTEMDVEVKEGQTTEIATQAVTLTQVANLAYITGTFDEIENILIDTLGYTATAITWNTVGTFADIATYDAIFINCGTSNLVPMDSIVNSHLANYVANGGSLYVSDWSVKFLVGKPGGANDPCGVVRTGGFIDDSLLCVRKAGASGSLYNNPIVSASLQTYLNKTSIDEIDYNLGSWEKIYSLNNNFWETMVTSIAANPLLIRTNAYTNPTRGTLLVGTAANNGYSLVCVAGTGAQRITLSVKSSDVGALVAAGATVGMCDNLTGGGRIYFTTFHNEPNGLIGADIKNILEYVILNL